MTAILYINDNNLRLQPSVPVAETDIIRSQGYVWFKTDKLVFDTEEANAPIKYCRLAPQEMNSRYWSQCERSSIANNAIGMRHAADLIWAHVSELQKQYPIKDLILVVPSHYQSSNLQLLLGIFESLKINVVGLVNGALLSLSDQLQTGGDYVHLDVQLHQTVSSHIRVEKGVAKLTDVDVIQNVGIQAMQDALLKMLQTQFIQNDRFDPLHYAETEQQLFDKLTEIAEQVNESAKATVSVQHEIRLHSTSLDAKVWNQTLDPFVGDLLSALSKADHGFVQLNGLFGRAAWTIGNASSVTLLNDFVIQDTSKFVGQNDSEGSLQYITQLTLDSVINAAPITAQEETKKPLVAQADQILTGATHLLQSGIAVPIEHCDVLMDNHLLTINSCAVGNAQAMLEQGKLFVMGDESCKEFRPNDRLGSHLAEGVITVIQVV